MTDQHATRSSDLDRLLRVLRRRLQLIVLCVVVVGASALGFSLHQQKQYSANAWLLFRDPAVDRNLFQNTTAQSVDSQRQAATNLRLVSLPDVADRASIVLGGTPTGRDIRKKIVVSGEGNSDVVSVTATDSDPELAANLANVFARQFIAIRREADQAVIRGAEALVEERLKDLTATDRRTLQSRADDLKILAALQTGKAELAQAASVPTSASSPRTRRNTLLGLLLGVVLGIGVALLIDRLDRRLKDPRELAEAYRLPVLGTIPESRGVAFSVSRPMRENGAAGREVVAEPRLTAVEGRDATAAVRAFAAPGSEANGSKAHADDLLAGTYWEAFRKLRAKLRYFNVDRNVVSVVVTSATSGEGKTTVAANLALAAAAGGQTRVLLLEADLRQPGLSSQLGLAPMPGLTELLTHDMKIREATQTVTLPSWKGVYPSLDVMVSGAAPPNPSELLESRRMSELLKQLRTLYDLIIIDTPPLSLVADAMPLMRRVDGVVAVTRLGLSTRDDAQHLRHELETLRAPTLGIVVNGVKVDTDAYYGYGYASEPVDLRPLERTT